jgi:integrase
MKEGTMARRGDGLYLRGSVWYLDARISGQRFVTRLGKGISRSVAAELAAIKRAAFLKNEAGIGTKKKDILFDDAAKRFVQWCEAGNIRPRTLDNYKKCVKQLNRSFDGKLLSQIHSFAIAAHKKRRQASPVRANRELQLLRRIFYWCMGQKTPLYEGLNPLKRSKDNQDSIRFYEESDGKNVNLEPDESARLIAAANEPIKSMMVLALNTGVRLACEGLTLEWDAVDFRRQTITIRNAYAKNKQSRTIKLNRPALDTLLDLKQHAKGSLVFCTKTGKPYKSIRTSFDTACEKAGLPGITPHDLRHTWCSRLGEKGVDDRTLQELGGWKTLKMVQRYSHTTDRRKAEAVKLLESFHNAIHNTEVEPLAAVR